VTHGELVARLRAAGCVFAEDEAELITEAAAGSASELERMASQRESGLPLEQVAGWAEFCEVRVRVAPGVFVPRPRSELLVVAAAARARPGCVVVDLCCGTGALGLALARSVAGIQLHVADIDPVAVACARENVVSVGGRVYEGDLFEPLPTGLRGRVGVLLANVPYVPTAEVGLLPREARDHELRAALDGGADGLDVARRVAASAPEWLAGDGCLLFEVAEHQVAACTDAVVRAGLTANVERAPDLDATCIVASRPGTR
jgi:release factor glutamine methyltransferase